MPDLDLFKPITIGNNIFIGYGTVILPGAIISDNKVTGAMSFVIGFIPPDSICAGVLAKKILLLQNIKNEQSKLVYQLRIRLLNTSRNTSSRPCWKKACLNFNCVIDLLH